MSEYALPVCLVLPPVSFIDRAIGMQEATLAFGHVAQPVPLVFGPVRPDLDPETLPLAPEQVPLALIDGAIIEYVLLFIGKGDVLVG